jgi:hypothetical protein
MSGPWEKYAAADSAPADGPWAKYAQPDAAPKKWQPVHRDLAALQAMAGPTEAQATTTGDRIGLGLAKTARDLVLGTAQSAAEGGPGGQIAAWMANKAGHPVPNPVADYLTGQVSQARQADRELTDTRAGFWSNVGGNAAATFLPGSAASKAAKLPAAAKYAVAALSGAGFGETMPVAAGESRATNVGASALLGTAGQKVANVVESSGAKAAAAITPELRKIYEYAKSKGIQLSPAQLSDSVFVKRMAHMLDRLPFSGAPARAAAQQEAGNTALAGLIGQKAKVVDQGTMAQAAHDLGQKFDKVFSAGTKLDTQFGHEITALQMEAEAQLDDTARRAVAGWMQRIKEQAKGGFLPPHALQSLDQQIRKAATGGGDRQQIAQAFREALHENFGRNAPAGVKQAWDQARRQYATMKTLEPVVARNPEGVPLQQLQGAVNASKAGRTARARGKDGELGQLASVGQRIKGPHSSGTAENLQAAGMGAGAITSLPLTLATLGLGGLGARAMNSKGLSALLMRENPGAWRREIAPFLPAGFFGLAPAAAAAKQPPPKR